MTQHLTSILIFCDCFFHLLIECISSKHSTHWYPRPTTSRRKTHSDTDTKSCSASSSISSGNQNIKWDFTSYLLRCLLPKKQKITSTNEDVKKLELLWTVDGSIKQCCHCGTQFLKKLDTELLYDIYKWLESRDSNRYLYANTSIQAHYNIIHNSQRQTV